MSVAVIDYGAGNLTSVLGALDALGADARVARDASELGAPRALILPGVGGFAACMNEMEQRGWPDAIRQAVDEGSVPMLGICLGMQMLASRGTEGGDSAGLGLIGGSIERLSSLGCTLPVPHVGWNAVTVADPACPLLAGIPSGTDFYFVHSYGFVAERAQDVPMTVDYGVPISAVVGSGKVFGAQFHPEKSSKAGMRLLRNFLDIAGC